MRKRISSDTRETDVSKDQFISYVSVVLGQIHLFLLWIFWYCRVQFCFFSPLTATTSLTSLLLSCQSITNLPVSMKKNTWKRNKWKVRLSVCIIWCGHLNGLQLCTDWPFNLHDNCFNKLLTRAAYSIYINLLAPEFYI